MMHEPVLRDYAFLEKALLPSLREAINVAKAVEVNVQKTSEKAKPDSILNILDGTLNAWNRVSEILQNGEKKSHKKNNELKRLVKLIIDGLNKAIAYRDEHFKTLPKSAYSTHDARVLERYKKRPRELRRWREKSVANRIAATDDHADFVDVENPSKGITSHQNRGFSDPLDRSDLRGGK